LVNEPCSNIFSFVFLHILKHLTHCRLLISPKTNNCTTTVLVIDSFGTEYKKFKIFHFISWIDLPHKFVFLSLIHSNTAKPIALERGWLEARWVRRWADPVNEAVPQILIKLVIKIFIFKMTSNVMLCKIRTITRRLKCLSKLTARYY
jgi:hypothetical protein